MASDNAPLGAGLDSLGSLTIEVREESPEPAARQSSWTSEQAPGSVKLQNVGRELKKEVSFVAMSSPMSPLTQHLLSSMAPPALQASMLPLRQAVHAAAVAPARAHDSFAHMGEHVQAEASTSFPTIVHQGVSNGMQRRTRKGNTNREQTQPHPEFAVASMACMVM